MDLRGLTREAPAVGILDPAEIEAHALRHMENLPDRFLAESETGAAIQDLIDRRDVQPERPCEFDLRDHGILSRFLPMAVD